MEGDAVLEYIEDKVLRLFHVHPSIHINYLNTARVSWEDYTLYIYHDHVKLRDENDRLYRYDYRSFKELYQIIDYIFDRINPCMKH